MKKSYLASMAALFLWAGISLGQGPAAPLVPPLDRAVDYSPDGHPGSCCVGEGYATHGVVSAEAEYVLWFLANAHDSFPVAATGPLGAPGTRILGAIGDAEHEKDEPGSGGRFRIGYWQTQENPWVPGGIRDVGVEAVVFFVGQRSVDFADKSSSTIFRPFFDVNHQAPSGFVVSFPGLASGAVRAHSQADLWGAEANVWKNVGFTWPGTNGSVDMMAGFRYLDLNERIDIGSVTAFNPSLAAFPAFLPFAGNTLQVTDSFSVHNRFYGGQVGITGKWWPAGHVLVEGTFKVAVGTTSENLLVAGGQLRTLPDATSVSSPAGLLALPSNIGSHHINKFAQVPELSLKLSAPVASHVTVSAGFSAMYWSRVMRPAQQIDRDLDVRQIPNFPGAASAPPTGFGQPDVSFRQSDLWALGISVGVGINW